MKSTRTVTRVLAFVSFLAALGVAACSQSGSPTAPNGGGGGGVTGGGAGQRFNLGPFARGQSAVVEFPSEGAFGYHCIAHQDMGMVGAVHVDADGADSAVVQMTAAGFSFSPAIAHIKPGGHVRWVNQSTLTNHTVTSDAGQALRATGVADRARAIRSEPQVFQGAGDISASIAEFRAGRGTLNRNQPGPFGSGRREINWDAVPALNTNRDDFPADFFNQPVVGRARGAVFSTPGSGFRVSDDNFSDVNPSYAQEFDFFSPIRTFIAVGDPVSTVRFFVPGSTTPATSTGFGVVFSDVDHEGSARIRLFDAAGRNLGTYLAPPSPGGLSFVGVEFPEAIVASVEILSGKAALGADSFDLSSRTQGPARDLVIMDDFVYGEPIAVAQ